MTTPLQSSLLIGLLLATVAAGAQETADLSAMKPYTATIPGSAVKIDMVPIPVGADGYPKRFRMGSPEGEKGRRPDEGPRVEVEVAPFWIGKFEVTWDTYNEFRREYSIQLEKRLSRESVPAQQWADAVSIPTPLWEQDSAPILEGLGVEGGFPAADISQFSAMQFTKWLSKRTGHYYRLPTEAEWEYAARAGTSTAYYFGDDAGALGDHAWTFDNTAYDDFDKGYPGLGAGYRKIGLKKANPWGLHDVYGNVCEWVLDGYAADRYGQLTSPVSWKDAFLRPRKVYPCVVRGGGWESDPAECRSATRIPSTPKWQKRDPQIPKSIWWCTDAFHVGFRVLRPLVEPAGAERLRYWESDAPGIVDILATGGKELRVPVEKTAGESLKAGTGKDDDSR